MTGADVIAKVRERVNRSPDNIYRSDRNDGTCAYLSGKNDDGSFGCLIGQVLLELGCDRQILEEYDYRIIDKEAAIGPTDLEDLLGDMGVDPLWGEELEWLQAVQQHQDVLDTWGDSVKFADGLHLLSS